MESHKNTVSSPSENKPRGNKKHSPRKSDKATKHLSYPPSGHDASHKGSHKGDRSHQPVHHQNSVTEGAKSGGKLSANSISIPNKQFYHGQGRPVNQPQNGKNSDKTILKELRDRAKADARFASSSSQWYAGSAFDWSPDANTLPKPKFIPINRGPDGSSTISLASSCPNPSTHTLPLSTPKKSLHDDAANEKDDLSSKSAELLKMLRSSQASSTAPSPLSSRSQRTDVPMTAVRSSATHGSSGNSCRMQERNSSTAINCENELEEMTLQVRRLLKMSQ